MCEATCYFEVSILDILETSQVVKFAHSPSFRILAPLHISFEFQPYMHHPTHQRLVSFIWSIADDCLRDVYVRGKYRDVILPMVVLRRIDALLEPTKEAVMEEVRFQREEAGFAELEAADLQRESGHVFYNISPWTLQRLHDTATNSQQILQANMEEYLDGFSGNVKEIIDKFKLRSQMKHMAGKDVLLDVIEKFTDPRINLTPDDKQDPDGRLLPGLSNLGMGYVFEELIRKFNEENNEEAGEHFTPREVIDLMTHLVFEPLRDRLPSVMTIYDPACGSGGMLTESQNFVTDPEGHIQRHGRRLPLRQGDQRRDLRHLQIRHDDQGQQPREHHGRHHPDYRRICRQAIRLHALQPALRQELEQRAEVHQGRQGRHRRPLQGAAAATTGARAGRRRHPPRSDGQLLFLMEMVKKMKTRPRTRIGSRIASVHNGSSLFTGDAGGGESNIRRYIIENDLLEAIIQLPNNLFYNTGITTYIWLLNNHKAAERRGKVILVDASELYRKLRKNLGAKNCELSPEHIAAVQKVLTTSSAELASSAGGIEAEGAPRVQVFDNDDFGYYKVTVERPERLRAQLTADRIAELRYDKYLREPMAHAWETYGERVYTDLKGISKELLEWCEKHDLNLSTKNRKKLTTARHLEGQP